MGRAPSEGLAMEFAPLYSWVYRQKDSVHRIDVGAALSSTLYGSVRPAEETSDVAYYIGLHMLARAVCPPYVHSWFWLGTSKAQTHLRHSNHLQL